MTQLEIVAHRGVPDKAPENTIAAFERAIELGADAVELDVRLTADGVPVVYHYFYLDENTSVSGPIFNYTFEQLQEVSVWGRGSHGASSARISTLHAVLDAIGGRIGLEIEIKGPEPEAPTFVAEVLRHFKPLWDTVEVTSYYEPILLLSLQEECPGLKADLLIPRSEVWMRLDVVAYQALQRARLAQAHAVHLHPSQLSWEVVSTIRRRGIEIHAWDVNDEQALETVLELDVARVDTDHFQKVFNLYQRKIRE